MSIVNSGMISVRRLLWMVLCTLCIILTSCGPGGNSFRIRGRFRDMQAGELYIYNLSSDNARFDTLTVQEGKDKGAPLRTHKGGVWQNGYGDHYPTMIYLIKNK